MTLAKIFIHRLPEYIKATWWAMAIGAAVITTHLVIGSLPDWHFWSGMALGAVNICMPLVYFALDEIILKRSKRDGER